MMCDIKENVNMTQIKRSLELAEILASINLTSSSSSSSPSARIRKHNLNNDNNNNDDVTYVPPKQVLLYLVRMGSFSSTPKILNDDNQDSDIHIPDGMSRQELLQYCQKQQQTQMFKRSFRRSRETQESSTYGFKVRKLNTVSKGCSDFISSPFSLRIFQWNILSQALGQMHDNFVGCPQEALEWNSRKYHIVEEIVEYCPDVICLQEVDHFNFLKHILSTQGYHGVFFPKPDSPCVYIRGNNGPDGCAIFFRRNKFDLIKAEYRILEIWRVQSNQVAILTVLRIKETGQEICIATTHLKARNGALLSTLRNEQGKDLMQFIKNHSDNRPVIICGDFNAEPTEPVYKTLTNDENLLLSSAYADCLVHDNNNDVGVQLNKEPPYTTWKIRENEGEICHTIDYIFYNKNKLDVDSVLQFPTGDEIGDGRVPSLAFPSDHFSLVADFNIINHHNETTFR